MKKGVLLGLVLALGMGLSACSKDSDNKKTDNGGSPKGPDIATFKDSYPAVKGTVYGGWEVDRDSSPEVTIVLNVYIKSGEVRIAAACTKNDGATVTVSVVSPAVITEDSIEVLEAKEVKDENGAINCTASIQKAKLNYKIQADDTLSIEGGAGVKRIN
ncbi:MAG: hypothetical protein ACXWC9_06265 [Pseudobdellovibrionaceae bacterium]